MKMNTEVKQSSFHLLKKSPVLNLQTIKNEVELKEVDIENIKK